MTQQQVHAVHRGRKGRLNRSQEGEITHPFPPLTKAATNLSGVFASAGLIRTRSLMSPPAIESQLDSFSAEYTKEKATHMLIDALRVCMDEVADDLAEITTHLNIFYQVWAAIRSDTEEISQRLRLGMPAMLPESIPHPVCQIHNSLIRPCLLIPFHISWRKPSGFMKRWRRCCVVTIDIALY